MKISKTKTLLTAAVCLAAALFAVACSNENDEDRSQSIKECAALRDKICDLTAKCEGSTTTFDKCVADINSKINCEKARIAYRYFPVCEEKKPYYANIDCATLPKYKACEEPMAKYRETYAGISCENITCGDCAGKSGCAKACLNNDCSKSIECSKVSSSYVVTERSMCFSAKRQECADIEDADLQTTCFSDRAAECMNLTMVSDPLFVKCNSYLNYGCTLQEDYDECVFYKDEVSSCTQVTDYDQCMTQLDTFACANLSKSKENVPAACMDVIDFIFY